MESSLVEGGGRDHPDSTLPVSQRLPVRLGENPHDKLDSTSLGSRRLPAWPRDAPRTTRINPTTLPARAWKQMPRKMPPAISPAAIRDGRLKFRSKRAKRVPYPVQHSWTTKRTPMPTREMSVLASEAPLTNRMNPFRSSLQSTNCMDNGLTATLKNQGVGRLGGRQTALQKFERLLNKAVAKNLAGVEMDQFPKRKLGESSRLAGPNLQKVARKLAVEVPKHPSRGIKPVEIKPARKVETTNQFLQTSEDHRQSGIPRWSTLPEMAKRPLSEVVLENLRVIF